jgi:hypothetical protein
MLAYFRWRFLAAKLIPEILLKHVLIEILFAGASINSKVVMDGNGHIHHGQINKYLLSG